jgi:hypothetical protein
MTFVAIAVAALLSGQATEPMPAASPAPAAAPSSAAIPTEPALDEVRAATARFRDVKVALAEGYIRDPDNHCVVASDIGRPAADGAMGVHYIRMDLLGVNGPPNPRIDGTGTHTDFNKPAILLYEPKPDGSLELVGIVNLVFKKAWAAAGNAKPPTFQGVAWDSMEDDPATEIDEGHMFMPHYDRHVWLYRDNPSGMYSQFNANVSCAAHKAQASDHSAHHEGQKAAAPAEEEHKH